jgi:S1-C subfamily serine protease
MVEILATDNIERRSGNAMEFQVQAEGSGLLVRRHDQTYVATADHVAAAGKIHVLRGFGTSEGRFDGLGAVVKRDSDADVALLELGPSANNSDPLANRAMLLREDAAIAVKGQAIMQLGFREHQLVMTIGRVEGAGPFYTFDDGSVLDEVRKNLSRDAELVKSSAAIQKGMSGGPGFDMDGNLLGLNAVGRSLSMLLEGRDVKFELDSYLSSTKALITMLDQVHAETAATNRSWVGRTLAFWRGRPK